MATRSKRASAEVHDTPYFDSSGLTSRPFYVGRIDMMGAKAAMTRSISVSANFVGKLHVALLRAPRQPLKALIPTVDGAYIISDSRAALQAHMGHALRSLARLFVAEKNRYNKFIPRGGIAYGPVVLGEDFGPNSSDDLARETTYRDSIVIGMPVVQAYEVEERAPPFGVSVHVSARAFAPEDGRPLVSSYWKWWQKDNDDRNLVLRLKESVNQYFEFMESHELELDYPKSAIDRHRKLFQEYTWGINPHA